MKEKDLQVIYKLLRENCNLADISGTLRALKVPFSAGSWKDLFEKRLTPAFKEGRIGRPQLLQLIRDGEEYGRQHVFLFSASKTDPASVINENYVERELKQLGRLDLFKEPPILDAPKGLTLADVRFEQRGNQRCLIVKAIEQRTYERFVGQRDESTTRFIREYERFRERAVNVARVHPTGLLEIRVYSHRNTSDYGQMLQGMWDKINFLVPQNGFEEVSISPAKGYLWINRDALARTIRYTSSSLRDGSGTTLAAAAPGGQQSLFDNAKATASIEAFRGDSAYFDRSNVWWVRRDGGPSKDVHTLLAGAVNEFALTAQCSREDYDYVLDWILKANG